MSEARSLTPLSETDYVAIEAAVMETARGRWFMAEFAKRNRQADTLQLLGALNRIERVVGHGLPEPMVEPDIGEAAALIADLRIDLERISGKAEARASGLAARIETAATTIVAATESVQEIAWSLREAGASEALCDLLDQRAVEISVAGAVVDGTVQQIDKIADTIAMLDSSLRAVSGRSHRALEAETFAVTLTPKRDFGERELGPRDLGALDAGARDRAAFDSFSAIEIVEIDDDPPAPAPAKSRSTAVGLLGREPHMGTMTPFDDDVVFSEPAAGAADTLIDAPADAPAPAFMTPEFSAVDTKPQLAGLTLVSSEAGLRDLDGLPTTRKLAYFA